MFMDKTTYEYIFMQVCYRLHSFLLKYAVRFLKRLTQLQPQERRLLVDTIRDVSCVTQLLPSDFRPSTTKSVSSPSASTTRAKLFLLFSDVRIAFENPSANHGDPSSSLTYSAEDLGTIYCTLLSYFRS